MIKIHHHSPIHLIVEYSSQVKSDELVQGAQRSVKWVYDLFLSLFLLCSVFQTREDVA